MSKVNFPKRHPDGSFCIDVSFSVATENYQELSKAIVSWATEWAGANTVWLRRWEPTGKTEELRYADEFKGPLTPVFCDAGRLTVRLQGQPAAQWWRDWLVSRIIPELKQSFSEIRDGVEIKDC